VGNGCYRTTKKKGPPREEALSVPGGERGQEVPWCYCRRSYVAMGPPSRSEDRLLEAAHEHARVARRDLE
jgi:hypothetical protein